MLCFLWLLSLFAFIVRSVSIQEMSAEILHPGNTHHASHLVSDMHFWKDAWKLMANANFEHSQAINKFLTRTEYRVGQLGPENKLLLAEKTFVKELRLLQDSLRTQMDSFRRDSDEYFQLKKNIKQYEDDPDLRLISLNVSLTQARTKLETQAGLVAKCKQEYHKSMWHAEKGAIKDMLADKESNLKETRKSIEDLNHRAQAHLDKYNKHLDKWHTKLDKVKQLSADYEQSFISRETSRANVVLQNLKNSIEMTSNSKNTSTTSSFDDVDANSIIRTRLIKKDTVDIPIFEAYKETTGKKKMYAKAKARIQTDTDRSAGVVAKRGQGAENDEGAKQQERLKVNKKLKKVKLLYLTVKVFQRQEMNQLTLRVGDYVRQLLPANDEGYAYGEVVHGKIRRKKKKGFYPECHVKNMQAEDLDVGIEVEDLHYSEDEFEQKKICTDGTRREARKVELEINKMTDAYARITSAEDGMPVTGDKVADQVEDSKKSDKCDNVAKDIKKKKRGRLFSGIAKSSFVRKLKHKDKKHADADAARDLVPTTPPNPRPDNDVVETIAAEKNREDDIAERKLATKIGRNVWAAEDDRYGSDFGQTARAKGSPETNEQIYTLEVSREEAGGSMLEDNVVEKQEMKYAASARLKPYEIAARMEREDSPPEDRGCCRWRTCWLQEGKKAKRERRSNVTDVRL